MSPQPSSLRNARVFIPADVTRQEQEALFREIVQQGEAYIEGQVRFALAADQRAINMATAFSTFSSVLLAAALGGLATIEHCQAEYFSGLLVAAILQFCAVMFAMWSARPQIFHTQGFHPHGWKDDLASKPRLLEHLVEIADDYQSRIDKNEIVLRRNAQTLSKAKLLGFAAPVVGAVIFGLAVQADISECRPWLHAGAQSSATTPPK